VTVVLYKFTFTLPYHYHYHREIGNSSSEMTCCCCYRPTLMLCQTYSDCSSVSTTLPSQFILHIHVTISIHAMSTDESWGVNRYSSPVSLSQLHQGNR